MSKRPENLAFPLIYYTFKAKDKNSDKIVEYRVQDLPEEYYEQTLDLLVKYFIPYETFCSSRDIANKPSTIKCIRDVWNGMLTQKLSIGCFKNDGSEEFIGANVLMMSSKSDPEDLSEFEDKDMADIMRAYRHLSKQFDAYTTFRVDKYLSAFGLCVIPEYRGRGIATEMLRARLPMIKALGIKVTSNTFSAIGSQIAAKKAGYEEAYVISYHDLEKALPDFDFSKSATKYFKTMYLKL